MAAKNFSKSRITKEDVRGYMKKDTGTAGKPQPRKATMAQTRVSSGGVTNHPVTGKSANARMTGTRRTSSNAK